MVISLVFFAFPNLLYLAAHATDKNSLLRCVSVCVLNENQEHSGILRSEIKRSGACLFRLLYLYLLVYLGYFLDTFLFFAGDGGQKKLFHQLQES